MTYQGLGFTYISFKRGFKCEQRADVIVSHEEFLSSH